MTWVAYVDESMRQKLDGTGIYVLAAAMIDPAQAESLRDAVLGLRRGRRPFHWRLEEPADKRKAVATVAGLDSCISWSSGPSWICAVRRGPGGGASNVYCGRSTTAA